MGREGSHGPCGAGEESRPPEGDGRAPTAPGTWCPHGRAASTRHSPQVRRGPCSLQGLGAALRPLRTASPSSSKRRRPEPFGVSSSIPAAACGPPLEWPRSKQHRDLSIQRGRRGGKGSHPGTQGGTHM